MNKIQRLLPVMFATLLPLGALACSTNTSSKGQMITCTTDPGTGVILDCVPGGGGGSGSGTCVDIDEDGDGQPSDTTTIAKTGAPGDADGDGVPDSEDCDEHPGEDGGGNSADLPYDVKPQLGQTSTPVLDAFAENGGTAPTIVSVTGATWRLTELQASTPFVVTQADCDHVGNRDIGRDRVIVTWQNANGSTSSDHLDIRYCN